MRKAASLIQEQLAEILDTKQFYVSQIENRENIAMNTLMKIVTSMGDSMNIVINFLGQPDKSPVELDQIEELIRPS